MSDEEIERRVQLIMRKTMDRFIADPNIIFDGSSSSEAFRYGVVNDLKSKIPPRECIVPGCSSRTIKNSHTIQKSGSLKLISENGFVIGPRYNFRTVEMEMASIGLNNASTFPGYCEEHEKLFFRFEQAKEFYFETDILLQMYRTLCKDIVVTEHKLEQYKKHVPDFKTYTNSKIQELLEQELFADKELVPHMQGLKTVKFNANDTRIIELNRYMLNQEKRLNEILYPAREALVSDIIRGKAKKFAYSAFKYRRTLPVAVSTTDTVDIKLSVKSNSVFLIINVQPRETYTEIFIGTFKKHTRQLKAFMSNLESPLNCLDMIETWIIGGIDKWFLQPTEWEIIDQVRKSEIVVLLNSYEKPHVQNLPMSILNSEKIYYLQRLYEIRNKLDSEGRDFFKWQLSRLTTSNYPDELNYI